MRQRFDEALDGPLMHDRFGAHFEPNVREVPSISIVSVLFHFINVQVGPLPTRVDAANVPSIVVNVHSVFSYAPPLHCLIYFTLVHLNRRNGQRKVVLAVSVVRPIVYGRVVVEHVIRELRLNTKYFPFIRGLSAGGAGRSFAFIYSQYERVLLFGLSLAALDGRQGSSV